MHGGQQAVGELAFALLEGRDHRLDHRAVSEHIARRHALFARHRVVRTEGFAAAEMHAAAQVINRRQLPVLAVAVAGQGLVDGLGRREAVFEQVEHVRAQGRQRDVLGRDRAHTGPQPRAARTHGDTR